MQWHVTKDTVAVACFHPRFPIDLLWMDIPLMTSLSSVTAPFAKEIDLTQPHLDGYALSEFWYVHLHVQELSTSSKTRSRFMMIVDPLPSSGASSSSIYHVLKTMWFPHVNVVISVCRAAGMLEHWSNNLFLRITLFQVVNLHAYPYFYAWPYPAPPTIKFIVATR